MIEAIKGGIAVVVVTLMSLIGAAVGVVLFGLVRADVRAGRASSRR